MSAQENVIKGAFPKTAKPIAAGSQNSLEMFLASFAHLDAKTPDPHDVHMEPVSRPEIDAKLEAIEARMDARVASIEGKIDTMLAKMAGRDTLFDQKFAGVEESLKDTREAVGNLKTTTIVTAVGAVLTIVLGVAAFNATVLSNMVASFESGKNTSAAQAEVQQQVKETRQLLDDLRKSVPPPATKN